MFINNINIIIEVNISNFIIIYVKIVYFCANNSEINILENLWKSITGIIRRIRKQ